MEASEPRTIAILAEKPSVAQDIARVLGANTRGKGYLQGNGYVITWAIGHLVSLAQPHEIKPEWRQWRFDQLPILPTEWPLVVYEKVPQVKSHLFFLKDGKVVIVDPKENKIVDAID